MYSSRMAIQDCMEALKPEPITTDYVVVCKNSSDKSGWDMAAAGGFVTQLAAEYYTCKRVVAQNLNLFVISSYPLKAK